MKTTKKRYNAEVKAKVALEAIRGDPDAGGVGSQAWRPSHVIAPWKRQAIDGMAGSCWADIPDRYGPSTTCSNLLVRWRKADVWDRLLASVSAGFNGELVMIDSTCVRVHHNGATAKKGDLQIMAWDVPGAALPARSMLLSMLTDVLSGYDSDAIRTAAAAKGVWANIPSRSNRKQRFGFSSWFYRQRNLVERFFSRIKQFRGIADRYDKDPANFMATIKLICTRIWCAA